MRSTFSVKTVAAIFDFNNSRRLGRERNLCQEGGRRSIGNRGKGGRPSPSTLALRQCSHLVPGHRARVLFYAGHQCEHTFFPGTHARIRARCRCPSTRSRPCTRALNWALSPCVNTFFVGALALYPQTTCFRTHNSLSHSRFQ